MTLLKILKVQFPGCFISLFLPAWTHLLIFPLHFRLGDCLHLLSPCELELFWFKNCENTLLIPAPWRRAAARSGDFYCMLASAQSSILSLV